jgi:rRNA-processing protein FCF1
MKWDPRWAILVDTNLLLVLVVGWVAPARVGKVGRTAGYDESDFAKLDAFVTRFKYTVTTPHILCETTNLVFRGASGDLANDLHRVLRGVYALTDERFVTARKLSQDREASPLGLADTAVIEAARRGCTVLSADADLCGELDRRGLPVVNFNHYRFGDLSSAAT